MKKILITGGAGYIGSILATKLVNLGHKVTVVDILKYNKNSIYHLFSKKNFNFIKADIRNSKLIKKLLSKNEIIIPLAGLVGAPLCERKKREATTTNLNSIKDIVKYSGKKNKIIYLATNSGYGIGKKNKYCTEETTLRPISHYGKTKCEAENQVTKSHNYVSFRLATVFGASYRMRTDLLVNNFCYMAVKKKKLKIFEPHFRRNFVHINDVVDCIIFAINNFNKVRSNIYNLGLAKANISKINLARKIKKIYRPLKIEIAVNRSDIDKRDYIVSNEKLKKRGFQAKISLESGIKELINIFTLSDEKFINNY
mgnify:CR=1 FL=1